MKKEDYLNILQTYLKEDARKLGLGRRWTFQHDRDPKHTAKIVTSWLQTTKINVFQWLSQSRDLNPIETLWSELKKRVHQRKPQNLTDLEVVCKEEWLKITPEYCFNLINNYNNCLKQLIQQKRQTIDHQRAIQLLSGYFLFLIFCKMCSIFVILWCFHLKCSQLMHKYIINIVAKFHYPTYYSF